MNVHFARYHQAALAIATTLTKDPHVTTLEDASRPGTMPHNAAAGVATDRA